MSSLRTSQRRVDVALDLVRKQRALVDTTRIGSPAHRQASDVLALIEESHFLLSELHRIQMPFKGVPASAALPMGLRPDRGSVPDQQEIATPPGATIAPPVGRNRLSLALALVAAVVLLTTTLEVIDPAPMSLHASVLLKPVANADRVPQTSSSFQR